MSEPLKFARSRGKSIEQLQTKIAQLKEELFDCTMEAKRSGYEEGKREVMYIVNTQKEKIEQLQAIVNLLPKKDGLPVIPCVNPKDDTAERLGVAFRYK